MHVSTCKLTIEQNTNHFIRDITSKKNIHMYICTYIHIHIII